LTVTLLTDAAASGKTQAAVEQVIRTLRRDPFSKIWVLLPTDLQIANFRARLLDGPGEGLGSRVYFGVTFFDFYALYTRLLQSAGLPQRRIQDTARFHILRSVISSAPLKHFSAISTTPGFVALAADFIQELKQARITPAAFESAARTPRDHDLAAIYTGYQQFLRDQNLVDSEGEGWLALEYLESDNANLMADLAVDLLVIDGYDQFNLVQAALIGQLAARVKQTLITLTYERERAQTAHRRFAQTYERLTHFVSFDNRAINNSAIDSINPLPRRPVPPRDAHLEYLSRQLFETHSTETPVEDTAQDNESLILIEAPDMRREVESVLRRVKRDLQNGTRPDEVMIVARDLTPYAAYLLELATAYGLPFSTRLGMPLAENPAIAALLSLIDLASGSFARRAVLDTLRSPYLSCPDLNGAQIDQLERISRQQVVIDGRQNWSAAIERAVRSLTDEDGEVQSEALSVEDSASLQSALDAFFARISPPLTATPREWVRWLETLIGRDDLDDQAAEQTSATEQTPIAQLPKTHFNVIANMRTAEVEPHIATRDLAALACLKRVLSDVLAAYELLDAWTPIGWAVFRRELQTAIDSASINTQREHTRNGRVLISSVFDARGLSQERVYVLGLSEGSFPARAVEDGLYYDSERIAFRERGLPLLTRAERADESSVFYEISALARRTLTLSRPYSEKGVLWPPSAYWRAVQSVLPVPIMRIAMDAAPELAQAARFSEVAAAIAHGLNSSAADPKTLSVHQWLTIQPEHAARWHNAQTGRHIETRRASAVQAQLHDQYSGVLAHPLTMAAAADKLGAERVWSASQWNEYGACPFKFFARRLLDLQPLLEPEPGMTPMQRGNLIHEVLEVLYERLADANISIAPYNSDQALAMLDSVLAELFADAPIRHAFAPDALWAQDQQMFRSRLRDLVRADFSENSPISALLPGERRSVRQEAQFGDANRGGRGKQVILDGAAGPLRAQGFIDRMDEANGRVFVIDYKSGSQKFKIDDMVEGRNVQMYVYVLAAQALVKRDGHTVIGGAFWHVSDRTLSGAVSVEADQEALTEAAQNIHAQVIEARQGHFPNTPSKREGGKCARYCEFSKLCRVAALD